jgi:Family of unknown function (DUF5995)
LRSQPRAPKATRRHPAPKFDIAQRLAGPADGSRATPALSQELRQILEAKPATRISEVLARMKKIVATLPPGDGVRAFTALYLAVTEAVKDAAKPGEFEDARFVRWLDVVFANLYFEALRNSLLAAGPVPKAWAPLLEARGKQGVLPLQFALAGMNAHINRDLPLALVATCEGRRVELRDGSPQQRDFRRINTLLALAEAQVKAELVTDALRDFDVALGELDDVIAMWNVEHAREAAWTHAEALWAMRPLPHLRAEFVRTLDRMVGFAGRGLLRPVGRR